VIWPHGWENPDNFLLPFNNIYTNVQFTMEAEELEQMAIFPSWKKDISLGPEAHTHTNLCPIASILFHRAKAICDSTVFHRIDYK
jgi:hypothetical protein